MKEITGRLRITESTNKKNKKTVTHTFIFTKENGKPAQMDIRPDVRGYANAQDGDVIIAQMESGQIIKAVVPGKESAAPGKARAAASGADGYKTDPKVPRDLLGESPYNFVPYNPDCIVPPDKGEKRWSGEIVCSLSALTPLLVCGAQEKTGTGLTISRFMTVGGKPVIPGSSLKGMLRSLMEILSYSGMWPMNKSHLYWRVVTNKDYLANFSDDLLGVLIRKKGAVYTLVPTEITRENKKNDPGWIEVRVGKLPGNREPKPYYFKRQPAYAAPLSLNDSERALVDRLLEQMTPDQEGRWNEEKRRKCLAGEGLPAFYRKQKDHPLELGFCRYFRMAYIYTPYNLAWPDSVDLNDPEKQKVSVRQQEVDIARSIFGQAEKDNTFAGRVSVGPCELTGSPLPPRKVVLGGPKPTCLPFYLEQGGKSLVTVGRGNKLKFDRGAMNNYNKPYPSSKLRGRKLYWHHNVYYPDLPPKVTDRVSVELHPLGKGTSGTFSIRVKNLTDSELGCLFEALELKPDCRHKLGMGKPLGLGSVKLTIRECRVQKNSARYSSLSSRLDSVLSVLDQKDRDVLRAKFRAAIAEFNQASDYYELEQIRVLYEMLNYSKRPDPAFVEYMNLEDFQKSPVLPTPDEVMREAAKLAPSGQRRS